MSSEKSHFPLLILKNCDMEKPIHDTNLMIIEEIKHFPNAVPFVVLKTRATQSDYDLVKTTLKALRVTTQYTELAKA